MERVRGWRAPSQHAPAGAGDLARAAGEQDGGQALTAYRDGQALASDIAKADPGNAGWQHDVALSLQRTGHVAAQQGQRAEALAAYRRGLDIMRRLAALAPDHAAFKRDLAGFEARIAELSAAGEPPAAAAPTEPAKGGG